MSERRKFTAYEKKNKMKEDLFMQKKEGKIPENPDWSGFENWLAGEIIADKERICKAKDIGLICGTVIAVASVLTLGYNYHTQSQSMVRNEEKWQIVVQENNQHWIDYLSQYDFVSQDGEGYNYYNSDVGGDVNNGTESKTKKETEYGQRDGN